MLRPILLKLSGKALAGEPLAAVCAAVQEARAAGAAVVIVHGGGAQLDALAVKHGLTAVTVAGRRVTDAATLELAKMAFAANGVDLVAALRAAGVAAIPLPAGAGGLVTATRRPPQVVRTDDGETLTVDYGLVGDIVAVNPQPARALLAHGLIPVVSPLAMDDEGKVYNVNADTLAARLASALDAAELVMVSDVAGLYADPKDPRTLIPRLTRAEARALVDAGAARGGMRPKLGAVEQALALGVARVRICDAERVTAMLTSVALGDSLVEGGTLIA
jgi:acetylglutamate kinase